MKLYYYEHCPFSARVRMAQHLKGIKIDPIVLLADNEETLSALIGRHQIPVLVRDDGEPMTESMRIVRYLDTLQGPASFDPRSTHAVERWLEAAVPMLQFLGYPRWTRIGLAEFATPAAYEHFRRKKTESIGDFFEAVANTEKEAREMSVRLGELPRLIDLEAEHRPVNYDDFAVLPMLRSLSVVRAVEWPSEVRAYTERLAARAGLDTFFDRAL